MIHVVVVVDLVVVDLVVLVVLLDLVARWYLVYKAALEVH